MAKKRGEKPQREVTKHQLARWQQQRKRQRIILGLGILVIAAALAVMGAGWYLSEYQPLHETVIRVNDTEFDMNYYVKTLSFYGEGQPAPYLHMLADEVVIIIERNELVRQNAMKLGITVSDDAVDEALKGYDPPLSKDYRDLVRADLLIRKLEDEYFEQQVPVFAEQRHIWATFLESERQANEVRSKLESGEDFAKLAGELSLDDFSKTKEGDLGWQPKGILAELMGTSVPEEYAFSAEAGVLSQPLYEEATSKSIGYWLIEVLERQEDLEEALIQVILLGSKEEAEEVRARLEAGEDFGELAKEFSQHDVSKENGGALDWLTSEMMSPAASEFVFNPEVEPGTLSQPIRDDTVVTSGGYWLLKVADIEDNREISEENRDLLKAKALNEWLLALWDNPETKVESYLDDQKKEWAVLRVAGS